MCKLINLFEQDDAVDKEAIEVPAHTVSVGARTHIKAPQWQEKQSQRGSKVKQREDRVRELNHFENDKIQTYKTNQK